MGAFLGTKRRRPTERPRTHTQTSRTSDRVCYFFSRGVDALFIDRFLERLLVLDVIACWLKRDIQRDLSLSIEGYILYVTATTTTAVKMRNVSITRCCLHRVDVRKHNKDSSSSHPDAKSRRVEAEARKMRRRNGNANGARSGGTRRATTAVEYNPKLGGLEQSGFGIFEPVLNWAETNLGLVDFHGNVKQLRLSKSKREFAQIVEEGLNQHQIDPLGEASGSTSDSTTALEGERGSPPATTTTVPGGIVVAHFTAPWCKACEAMQKKMLEVYTAHRDVTFIKVDAKHNLQLCRDLGVKKLPWFQIYTPNQHTHTDTRDKEADRPELVVNVHANKENQKLLSRQISQIKQIMTNQ